MVFEKLIVTQLVKKSRFLMESEGSSPCRAFVNTAIVDKLSDNQLFK